MRGARCLRGLAILGIAIGGYAAPASISGVLGIGPAKAEKFYTRKRVNGQWITGLFPADETAPTRRPVRPRPVVRAKPAAATALAVATGAVAAASDTTPLADWGRAAEAALTPTPVRTEWAFAPSSDVRSIGAETRPEPAPPPAQLAADDRMSRLRSALLIRAQDLAAKSPDAGSAGSSPGAASVSKAMPDMGRADTIVAAAEPAKRPDNLEPRSVSYDFESGVKTTVFATSVVREPFDVASVKRITAPAR